jgi:hypothetical protein
MGIGCALAVSWLGESIDGERHRLGLAITRKLARCSYRDRSVQHDPDLMNDAAPFLHVGLDDSGEFTGLASQRRD